jgi:hypothetical protein
MQVSVTVDVHPSDSPTDILRCKEFFASRNIPVTFLISTITLQKSEVRFALKSLLPERHELGTHGHTHSMDEVKALKLGSNGQLRFLETSKSCFEELFGYSPTVFRSPVWCGIGIPARHELVRLGYKVDCSATPQRPGLLSSLPFESPWMFSSRKPHWLREGLLEVPTSTLLLPLASPTFSMLRCKSSQLFLKALMAETRQSVGKVLVMGFDTHDFDKHREYVRPHRTWRQLVPTPLGGFGWRYWLRTYRPDIIFSTVEKLFDTLAGQQFITLSQLLPKQNFAD